MKCSVKKPFLNFKENIRDGDHSYPSVQPGTLMMSDSIIDIFL